MLVEFRIEWFDEWESIRNKIRWSVSIIEVYGNNIASYRIDLRWIENTYLDKIPLV